LTDRRYSTPAAFKQALEQRLRNMTKTGVEFARRRQLLVFDRFLARVIVTFGESVILKGGLVLELRLDRARTTKDIDLRMEGSPDEVFSRLQEAGRLELGDFMTFELSPDKDHPEIVGDGIQYDGYRYRSECKLAGKLYGQPFGVDVAFGDPIYGDPEIITTADILAFADISPPALRLYPLETHIAEKLHAYTMPRSRINTRVKDLPDIALLATSRPIDSNKLQAALEQTFSFRKTHPIPKSLPAPPQAWDIAYTAMAREDHLVWSTLDEVTDAVQLFLDPILSRGPKAQWNPSKWKWSEKY
jgi:predicted nucleotidyltransferase component of viral defense system